MKLQWWGYVHENGTLQIKRYFDQRDIADAYESPFCIRISRMVEADSQEEATLKIVDHFRNEDINNVS